VIFHFYIELEESRPLVWRRISGSKGNGYSLLHRRRRYLPPDDVGAMHDYQEMLLALLGRQLGLMAPQTPHLDLHSVKAKIIPSNLLAKTNLILANVL
jgi:hypothetical protein